MQKTATMDTIRLFTGIQLAEGLGIKPNFSNYGADITGLPAVIKKVDGEPLDGTVLKTNQRVELVLGTINPKRVLLIAVNPVLYQSGTVQTATAYPPNSKEVLSIQIQTNKGLDLASLDYLMRIFVMEQ